MLSQLTSARLLRRNDPSTPPSRAPTTLTIALTVIFLVFALTALTVTGAFMYQRRRRSRRNLGPIGHPHMQLDDYDDVLPTYDIEKRLSSLSTTASSSPKSPTFYEKTAFDKEVSASPSSPSPPQSPIPEIRITFPEEIDEKGQRKSGAVVIVKVGELGNVGGLEGLGDGGSPGSGFGVETRRSQGERWQSVDLERVGGLVERARNAERRRE